MKKTISARHNANKQVLITLKSNESKFSGIPVMVTAVSDFETKVTDTNALIAKVGNIPDKIAGNKNIGRQELASIALKVGNILKVYAFIAKDENLANYLILSENELTTRMRQEDVLVYAKGLAERIIPIAADLINYGFSDALKEELNTEIKDYELLLTEPRQLINERKTTNELIEDHIDEIYSILTNKIDPLMELFVDDKEFYLAYKAARMIVDPATRKRTEDSEEIEETQE